MKSSSTTGLAYSFIPADTANQANYSDIEIYAQDIIKPGANLYLFEGVMPTEDILRAYTSITTLGTDYSTKLIAKVTNFDLKYTYDKATKTRKLQKFPVNAQSYASAVTGVATWACLELPPIALSSTYNCLLFTDAIGGWNDPDQSILVSSLNVVTGEQITIKDINITLRDAR